MSNMPHETSYGGETQHPENHLPYASEMLSSVEVSEQDIERGKMLVERLIKLTQAHDGLVKFSGIELFSGGEYRLRLREGTVMIVLPNSPIQRTIRKAGSPSSYDWMVKPETTESDKPLIIQDLKVIDTDILDSTSKPIVEGTSPYYPSYRGDKDDHMIPAVEEISRFDLTHHIVAIQDKQST